MNTFGKTGSGLMVLEKMLEMVNKNIQLWNSDGSVLLQIVRLFDTLSKNQDIRNALVESSKEIVCVCVYFVGESLPLNDPFVCHFPPAGQFNSIVMFCLTHLNAFPASIHSPLIQSIVVVATHTSNLEVRAHYFSSLSLAIEVCRVFGDKTMKLYIQLVKSISFHLHRNNSQISSTEPTSCRSIKLQKFWMAFLTLSK